MSYIKVLTSFFILNLFILTLLYPNTENEKIEAQKIIKNYLEYTEPSNSNITVKQELFYLDMLKEIENNKYLQDKLEEKNIYYYLNFYNIKLANLLMKPKSNLKYEEEELILRIKEIFAEIIEE